MRLAALALLVILIASPAVAATIPVDFIPSLYQIDFGAQYTINNYTLSVDSGATGGTWILFATNDQQTFSTIDSRNVTFGAGVQQNFNVTNTNAYRYYYLYLVSGFTVGSNIESHFSLDTPLLGPGEILSSRFNFTQKRSPEVLIFDFSKTTPEMNVKNYSIRSSDNLPADQDWYLFGTNVTNVLGATNPALFTLLDTQASIGFTAGVRQTFTLSGNPPFKKYVIYIPSGFDTVGTNIEVIFNSENPAPIASFYGAPTSGVHPLSVTFTDTSYPAPTSWNWSFGDGNLSTLQNPVYSYDAVGTFSVNLTVCNTEGCSSMVRSNYITVTPPTTPSPTIPPPGARGEGKVTLINIRNEPLPEWTLAGWINNILQLLNNIARGQMPEGDRGAAGPAGPAGIVKDSGSAVNISSGAIINHTLGIIPGTAFFTGTVPGNSFTVSNLTATNFTVSIFNTTTGLEGDNQTVYWMVSA